MEVGLQTPDILGILYLYLNKSHLANKQLKAMFNLCAVSAIQHNTEMKQYYQKRVVQGKNKMSTVNIIRNKSLARMFAVVKRQTPYVDNLKYTA